MEHGEKSLDIDFGDSDEEEDAVREGVGSGSANGGAVRGGVMAELTDAMEEDEEDGGGRATAGSGWRESRGMGEELDDNGFCLLDAPTSTYVVSVVLLFVCVQSNIHYHSRLQDPSQ